MPYLLNKYYTFLGSQGSYYCLHKSLPLVPILSQMNPVHIVLPNFCNTHCNIILSSMLKSSKWSLYFTFPHQNSAYNSPPYMPHSPHTHTHTTCPSYPSSFDHSNNSHSAVLIIKPPTHYTCLQPDTAVRIHAEKFLNIRLLHSSCAHKAFY